MMLNYLYFDLLVLYKGKLKTPIWHGVHPRYYVLVKEECTHHNPIIQFSSILHVLYVNILFLFLFFKSLYFFGHTNFFLPQT